jgi:endonuclease/exonuclease/phosphatase family metal-dependent hydrolase
MPAFDKPSFAFDYDLAAEVANLRRWRDHEPGRRVPRRSGRHLLIASWNIANLGAQQRRPQDHALIAEILSWFDLVAVQEVRENLADFDLLRAALPARYRALYSDAAGNDERMLFLYDSRKLALLEEVGEIALSPVEAARVRLPALTAQRFEGFDRTPYFASWRAGSGFDFQLVNVHLYFGSLRNAEESRRSINRRTLETLAVARWADQRRRSAFVPIKDIVVMGDFNLPKITPGDPIFDALTSRGLRLPMHTAQVGSNLAGDRYYDQIGFFDSSRLVGGVNVFDFDGAVFPTLWQTRSRADFNAYVRYYLSDHRPVWCQLRIEGRAA